MRKSIILKPNFIFLKRLLLLAFFTWQNSLSFSQTLNTGIPSLEEYLRREQVKGAFNPTYSFQLRPISIDVQDSSSTSTTILYFLAGKNISNPKVRFNILPVVSSTEFNSKRPYGWGNKGMISNVGAQTYLSTGLYARFHFLEIQFQPEYVYAQNKPFQGFSEEFPDKVIQSRFFFWNNADNPERFGNSSYSSFWWGQSSVNMIVGPINLGVSTQNIWWGPGQFNSLIFSDNAEGFPHLYLSTRRPLKTFVGNFESQVIMGRLENSGLAPTQNALLNEKFFEPFDGDWRYLNGITVTYNPRFLQGLFIGFSRTFQQFNKYRVKDFAGYFPIFEGFQKKKFLTNGNSVEYDSNGLDQQVAISLRYLATNANFEIYAEYGRRDHSYDWREFILNPEHARAYILGFQKLFNANETDSYIQLKGEITHQSESVNRYIRYTSVSGNQTWHTHGLARGFVNYGQTLGVGIGIGSNVQTLEVSKVDEMNKKGILLERLENNQDFFFRAFGQNSSRKPWIDYSVGLLWDQKWDNFILSSKAQFIKSYNYQWENSVDSSADFPIGSNKFAFYGSLNLIYRIGQGN